MVNMYQGRDIALLRDEYYTKYGKELSFSEAIEILKKQQGDK